MCNCIKKISDKAFKLLKKSAEKEGLITSGELVQVGFSMTGQSQTYTDYKYSLKIEKKNGTGGAIRNKTITMVHSFCPFCGEKYPDKK